MKPHMMIERPGRILSLLACLFSLFPAALEATEMTLWLEEVSSPKSMAGVRGPAVLYLEFDGEAAVEARILVPFISSGGDASPGTTRHFPLNAGGLSLVGGNLSGTASASVLPSGYGSPVAVSLVLDAVVTGGAVSGTYTGTFGGTAIGSTLAGEVVAETPDPGDFKASVQLYRGYANTLHGSFQFGEEAIRLWLEFSGGTLTEGEVTQGTGGSSLRDNELDAAVYPMIGPRGDTRWLVVLNAGAVQAHEIHAAAIGPDHFSASFTASYYDVAGRSFDYELSGTIIGNTLLGTYTVSENGVPLVSDYTFIGYTGTGQTPASDALPPMAPVVPAADSELSGFQPPYFAELTPAQIRDRVLAGALWLSTTPEAGVFGDDVQGAETGSEGDKHYDNAPFPAYGGAVAWGIVSQLATDPELQAFAARAARRAGKWIDNRGNGYLGLATYYKNMFFVSAWAAMAHMDLYETTGDQRWLDAVEGYMSFLRDQVQNRMAYPEVHDLLPDDGVAPGRTWIMLDEETGVTGISNRRYDRSSDNYELHPAEFLWLLGKLRVDHGVTEFAAFEAGAYQWVLDNLEDPYLWRFRPTEPEFEDPQAIGPTLFAIYLLDYAPSYDPADLDQVIQYVENVHLNWEHPQNDAGDRDAFTPSVRDYYPRWASGYLAVYVPGTAATSRMALVYLKKYAAGGDPVDLAKAKALALSTLNRQKTSSGMLDNLGHREFSDDHSVRLVEGPNGTPPDAFGNPIGRTDQHPYSGLKANALRNLLEFADLLESLGAGCSQSQTITAPTVVVKDPSDPPFVLSASASSGLPVDFEYIYGPASLDGATVTLDGTPGIAKIRVHQAGDAIWCEAASRSLFINIGDNVPAAPINLQAAGIDISTVALTWEDNADNETLYRARYRQQGETAWLEETFPANSVGANISGLTMGITYEFEVEAVNQVETSPPSNLATGTPISAPIYVFLEIGCTGLPSKMVFQDNPDAYDGQEVFVTTNQVDRVDITPDSILDLFFEVPATASYHLWLRGYTTEGGGSDSIWLKVDDGIHIGTGSDTFYATPIYNAGYGAYGWGKNNDTYPLQAGTTHKVSIAAREDGAVIDRLMFTTNSDLLTHYGMGDEPVNCGTAPQQGLTLAMVREDGSLRLEFPTEAGAVYELQVNDTLQPDAWEADGELILGDGAIGQIPVPVVPGQKLFFRLVLISAP